MTPPEPRTAPTDRLAALPRAALAMSPQAAEAVFPPPVRSALAAVCQLSATVLHGFDTDQERALLGDVDLLVTSWGCPPLHDAALAAAPRLRAVVHAAGSVRGHVTEACWARGIAVSSAASANAVPVAEYTVAMILLAGKQVQRRARDYRRARAATDPLHTPHDIGNYRKTVGIVSASQTGRLVLDLLRPYDFDVLLHDPYVTERDAARLGARTVGLTELFRTSHIVSLHTPLLPATRGLITADLLRAMPPGATLINTARGGLVDQDALVALLQAGRVHAVLDVTEPEVPPPGHPLWDCDNAVITPHLAGSQGNEWRRIAEVAIAETARWARGAPFAHPVHADRRSLLA